MFCKSSSSRIITKDLQSYFSVENTGLYTSQLFTLKAQKFCTHSFPLH